MRRQDKKRPSIFTVMIAVITPTIDAVRAVLKHFASIPPGPNQLAGSFRDYRAELRRE